MKILLSPAKSFKICSQSSFSKNIKDNFDNPYFVKDAKTLMGILKKKNRQDLKSLMKISDKVAELNLQRNQKWDLTQKNNSDPCLFTFNGDVYKSLAVESLSESEILFLQKHLLILSGLYGLLKPMDLIAPYRLEMGTSLINDEGKNLYFFWKKKLQSYCEKLEGEEILNLASNEYFKVLGFQNKLKVYNVVFKDYVRGVYKTVGILAKKARGKMLNYIAKNNLQKIEDIKFFKEDNYQFDNKNSDNCNLVFLRK